MSLCRVTVQIQIQSANVHIMMNMVEFVAHSSHVLFLWNGKYKVFIAHSFYVMFAWEGKYGI